MKQPNIYSSASMLLERGLITIKIFMLQIHTFIHLNNYIKDSFTMCDADLYLFYFSFQPFVQMIWKALVQSLLC